MTPGTTEGPGWPADPMAAPPAEEETQTLDEQPTELEPEAEEKPKKRGRPRKVDK